MALRGRGVSSLPSLGPQLGLLCVFVFSYCLCSCTQPAFGLGWILPEAGFGFDLCMLMSGATFEPLIGVVAAVLGLLTGSALGRPLVRVGLTLGVFVFLGPVEAGNPPSSRRTRLYMTKPSVWPGFYGYFLVWLGWGLSIGLEVGGRPVLAREPNLPSRWLKGSTGP
jgi:hypothetical protein